MFYEAWLNLLDGLLQMYMGYFMCLGGGGLKQSPPAMLWLFLIHQVG